MSRPSCQGPAVDALVAAHDADAAEAELLVDVDGALVGGRRIDGQTV